jgi:Protein of unknown function (DUF3237)
MSANIPSLEHVMTVKAQIEPLIDMGKTPSGQRRVVPIIGGTFEAATLNGAMLKGVIMPGGEDWQLIRDDGTMHLDARYWLRAEDNTIIRVHNSVLVTLPPKSSGEALPVSYARSTVKLEAPIGKHDWLNKAVFIGTIDSDFKQRPAIVTLNFYKVN